MKLPRYRTGNRELDSAAAELVDQANPPNNSDLVYELIASALRLAKDDANRGDLKIASAALKEMRYAFQVFAPYRAEMKVAIFGSARTQPDDPLYHQTRDFAAAMAERDWMIITGAGPGIMEAGLEGAGTENSFGVSINLPFEASDSPTLADDPKLINFRYFFTRKLSFVKEADGFVLLPGGFGTMDEAFELLTLVQTGKAQIGPIVLLDVPGGSYWKSWKDFVDHALIDQGYASPDDKNLVFITDNVMEAVGEITRFFSNYHSQRFVGKRLVIRLHQAPDEETLLSLSEQFADILTEGRLERVDATPSEIEDNDHIDLDRVGLWFDRQHWSRLRTLIDAFNEFSPRR